MSAVKYDSYTRGNLRRTADAVSGLHFFLMFVAAALLVLSRVDHPIAIALQKAGRAWSEPVLGAMSDIVRPLRTLGRNASRLFAVESEIHDLERELASLRRLLAAASDLERRNAELVKLARLVRTAPVSAVTAEVIGGPQGLFGKAVRVAAGRREGLRYGQPAFNGDGLIGRVVSVTETTALVLLLNDVNSRLPVEVGPTQEPALMVGDTTDRPRLVYLRASAAVRSGDKVSTSGASGQFPRGIVTGTAVAGSDVARVATTADLIAMPYLTVLLYDLPSPVGDGKSTTEPTAPSAKSAARAAMIGKERP